MKLFEFEFAQNGVKRAWGYDVYDALNELGFNDPTRALVWVVRKWSQISEVKYAEFPKRP